MEQFLKHIPFANESGINYTGDVIWKSNLAFYESSSKYDNENYPFRVENTKDNKFTYRFDQAHIGFIFTIDRNFRCVESFPSTGSIRYSTSKIRKEGKAPYNISFTNYVHGRLISGRLPISLFRTNAKAFDIDDGYVWGGAEKLDVEGSLKKVEAGDDYYYYKINTKGASIALLRDEWVLQIKLVHGASGLEIPFKKDEFFCFKLKQKCRAWLKYTYPTPSSFKTKDLEWFQGETSNAELKIDTEHNLQKGYVF